MRLCLFSVHTAVIWMIPDRGLSALRPSLLEDSAGKFTAYAVVGVISSYVVVSSATMSGSAKSGVSRAGLAWSWLGTGLLLGVEE